MLRTASKIGTGDQHPTPRVGEIRLHRIPDPIQKTTIRAGLPRNLIWYCLSPERCAKSPTHLPEWIWLTPAPLTLNTCSFSKKAKRHHVKQGQRQTSPQVGGSCAHHQKQATAVSYRTAGATGIHVHAAASSWGNGMTRSGSAAPESRPQWTTSDSAALLQQKCKGEGGYDFRRTGRSGGGQGVRTVREQALVRGAGRTARAPHC